LIIRIAPDLQKTGFNRLNVKNLTV